MSLDIQPVIVKNILCCPVSIQHLFAYGTREKATRWAWL